MANQQVLFVSGIDTNIGKSYGTALLKCLYTERGIRTVTQKFIQTGNTGRSEDIELHRRLLGEEWQPEDEDGTTAPIILSYPASPHLAAKLDRHKIDLSVIDLATQRLLETYGYELVLLEGAGGLMVPITSDYLTIDFVQERGYPVALVTSGRLGSINHTLLSLEACQSRGIEIAYLIYNRYPSIDTLIETDTLDFLGTYLSRHFPSTELIQMQPWEIDENELNEP